MMTRDDEDLPTPATKTTLLHDEGDLPSPVRKARHEYYRSIFDKYDTNGNGYIELKELREMLKDDDEVPRKIVRKVFKMSDEDNDGKINYHEFIGMIHNKKFKELFGHYVNTYIRFILPRQYSRALATDGLSASFDETEGVYEEQYTCCPPPIAMFIISAFELTCFLTDEMTERDSTLTGKGVTAEVLIYDPYKRQECWRYLTYMFVHIGYLHLVVNLAVQLLLGVPLEMIHKWWRVLLVYFAGVVAGSLATSITDPTSYLAGASGGVYALITAHVASIIMNWNEMSFPAIQLSIFVIITSTDVGTSIYNRYCLGINDHIGYAAHFAGAIAGLLVGIWILKNFIPTTKEKYIWWFALVLFILLMGVMVVLNIAWTEHFLKSVV